MHLQSVIARMRHAPGMEITAIQAALVMRLAPSEDAPDRYELTATVHGWGPSLHQMELEWRATSRSEGPDDIAAAFAPHMALQSRRAEAARQLGFSRLAPRNAALLTHMVADRLLMAVKAETPWLIENTARRGEAAGLDGLRTEYRRDSVTLRDGTSDDPRPRALIRTSMPWGGYDGETLTVRKEGIPETVVAAMVGRRIGEILSVGDRLAPAMLPVLERAVLASHSQGSTISLVTQPDWVTLVVTGERTTH